MRGQAENNRHHAHFLLALMHIMSIFHLTRTEHTQMTEYPTAPEIAAHIGTRNWVVARRTANILTRYGADVVCLSPQQFKKMQAHILLQRNPA
jgi:hypothetical protein